MKSEILMVHVVINFMNTLFAHTLWILYSGNTVGQIVHQFTHAMSSQRMRTRFIDFFSKQDCEPLHSISMERAGMPGAIGAIDGTYLPWIAPTTTNDFKQVLSGAFAKKVIILVFLKFKQIIME